MPEDAEPDAAEDLDDEGPDGVEEPVDEPGHPLTSRGAFPFLPKIVG